MKHTCILHQEQQTTNSCSTHVDVHTMIVTSFGAVYVQLLQANLEMPFATHTHTTTRLQHDTHVCYTSLANKAALVFPITLLLLKTKPSVDADYFALTKTNKKRTIAFVRYLHLITCVYCLSRKGHKIHLVLYYFAFFLRGNKNFKRGFLFLGQLQSYCLPSNLSKTAMPVSSWKHPKYILLFDLQREMTRPPKRRNTKPCPPEYRSG